MNIMDMIILIVLVGAMVLGYRRGLVLQLVSLAGFVIALSVAYFYYGKVAAWLSHIIALNSFQAYQKFDNLIQGIHLGSYIYNAIAFILLFFGVKMALNWFGQMINAIFKVPGLNFLNRWGGVLLSFLEGFVLIIIVLEVLKIIPQDQIQQQLQTSYFANMIFSHLSILPKTLQQLWNQNMVV